MGRCADAIRCAYVKGFRVTEAGELYNPRGKRIAGYVSGGYLTTGVRLSTERDSDMPLAVHRLAAYQWFGEAIFNKGVMVRHLDGNALNNARTNLALGTAYDNSMDMKSEARRHRSLLAAKTKRKLSEAQLVEFREAAAAGATLKSLCASFGISKSTASYIRAGRTYQ